MKRIILVGLLAASLGLFTSGASQEGSLKIQYFGHACFLITWPNGTSFLLDPFDPSLGYDMPSPQPSAVLVTHDHFDHNYVKMAKGEPEVINGLTDTKDWSNIATTVKGIIVKSVNTYHDDELGGRRGKNSAFVMEGQGWRVAHLGDLGHKLGQKMVEDFGRVDVLMIPVGGLYTIDAKTAQEVVEQLNPSVIIAMHYKTDKVSLPIEPPDAFVAGKLGVNRKDTNTIELSKLPDSTVYFILDYK